jgi:hypothetical protein
VLLELIHSDVFGPVKVPSISNVLYYVSSIDDYSIRTWLYFIVTKSDVFNWFNKIKDLLENQTSRKIKVLRIDNGNEFCSIYFDKFCNENDIEIHKKTPYIAFYNGFIKQMNRTLMERTRSMLSGANLEKN